MSFSASSGDTRKHKYDVELPSTQASKNVNFIIHHLFWHSWTFPKIHMCPDSPASKSLGPWFLVHLNFSKCLLSAIIDLATVTTRKMMIICMNTASFSKYQGFCYGVYNYTYIMTASLTPLLLATNVRALKVPFTSRAARSVWKSISGYLAYGLAEEELGKFDYDDFSIKNM